MAYTRECVAAGGEVVLKAIFLDGCNEPMALDEIEVEITDLDGNLINTLTLSGGDISLVTPGMYELPYTVPYLAPSSSLNGNWTDKWSGYVNGNKVIEQDFTFKVMTEGKVVQQIITNNTLIVVVLDETIADVDGNVLGEDMQFSFSTKYEPYYASPDLIRLEIGHWVDAVPDDTISLMIHWSSKEVDEITHIVKNRSMYDVAKTKFVIYDVAMRLLTLPIDINGTQKRLSELLIRRDGNFKNVMAELKKHRNEWFRVVNSGGTIVPGQSFAPSVAVKGYTDPDRGIIGRGWHHPGQYPYRQYVANASVRLPGQRKFKKGHLDLPTWYLKGDLEE